MRQIVVGIGELNTSNLPGDVLKTYALGSCVGVIMVAPRFHTAGLLHLALPESEINSELARRQPAKFADTGIPVMLEKMARMGCQRKDIIIKLAGGARILNADQHFEIGKRNILAVKKILWKYKLGAVAEDVGKNYSRTVTVEVATGKVVLSSPGKGEWEL